MGLGGCHDLWVIALCRVSKRAKRRSVVVIAGGGGLVRVGRRGDRLDVVSPAPRHGCGPSRRGGSTSAQLPTYRGLQVANERHHFKTIVNLFPEEKLGKSPRLAGELRFVREHGNHYIESPGEVAGSDAFLDETLRLAKDPSAWPILLHCHACMDRTPAWMGIYRFVVEGRPLREVMCEIEGHRGYRPKASVDAPL